MAQPLGIAVQPQRLPASFCRPVGGWFARSGRLEDWLRTVFGAIVLLTLAATLFELWGNHLLWGLDRDVHHGEAMRIATFVATALQLLVAVCGFVILREAMRHRARAADALAASERQLRAYFEQAGVGIAQIGPGGRILRANPRLGEMLGRPAAELQGASIRGFSHPQDVDVLLPEARRMHAGELAQVSGKKRYLRADGSAVWARVTLSLVRNFAGTPQYEIAVFEDITSERHSVARKRRLRAAFELSFDAMYIVSRSEMKIVDTNDAACRMLGYAREELVGAHPSIVYPDGAHGSGWLAAEFDAAIAGDGPTRKETTHQRRDGTTVQVEIQRTVATIDGVQYILGAARDISDRKAAETALRESEQRYRRLVEVSPDAVFVIQSGRIVLANPASLRLFGAQTESQLLGRPVLERIHADSRDRVLARLQALQDDASELPNVEQKYLRLDGGVVDVEVMATRFNFGGRPAVLSVARDVGERKHAEAALFEATHRLHLATEAADASIWDTDLRSGMVYLSDGWARLLGDEPRETRAPLKDLMAVVHPEDLQRVVAASIDVVRGRRERYSEDQRVRTRNGEWRWVRSGGRVIERDASGRAVRMAGTNFDVTERKRAEQLLAVEHAVTRSLASATHAADGLRAAVGLLCETEHWDFARIFEVDERAGLLLSREVWTRDPRDFAKLVDESHGLAFAPGVGLAGRVWQRAEPLWVADVRADARVHNLAFFDAYDLRNAFVFPFASEGRVIGVVAAFSRSVREPDERLMRAIGAIASQIGQFLARKRAEERLNLHAQRQERIARFGTFALDENEPARLFEEAVRAAGGTEADAATLFEVLPETGDFQVRAAAGDVAQASVGRQAALAPDSLWPRLLADGASRIVGRDYLGSRPVRPEGCPWVRCMGSAVYVPVRSGELLFGMLAVYAAREHAFGEHDMHHVETIASILSTALQRRETQKHLERLAQFDGLTGLPNRALFRDRLEQALTQARRNDWEVGLLFLDLDQFKRINDTLGHGAGDEALRAGDTVARLSGDEFAVVLPDLESPEDARIVAQKMLESLATPLVLGGRDFFAGASIGITIYPHDALDAESLLQNADVAMYQAKQAGRNGFRFFTTEMNADSARLLELERDLRYALERGEFELHYQPKVDVTGARITGAEALLRWRRPDGTLVSPAEFVPALEDSGVVVPVSDWALGEACRQLVRWHDAGFGRMRVAVNVSPRQFRDGRLVDCVRRALAESGCPAHGLEIEVTESMVMHDVDVTIETLAALRALGVRVAVDDFGTGYSSLAYLKKLPIDVIKIDRSFIKDVSSNANDAAIVTAIIGMARTLGYELVAEGVETPLQRQFLEAYGCHEIQGYLISRPLSAADLTAWACEHQSQDAGARRAA